MLPQHFGKYLLFDKIGTGGMAEVFLAKQSGLKGFEKIVAIKRILPHLTQDPEFIGMFINEAKLAALLTHQNIVQIFDLGHVENAYYIAMEYVMGKDLRTVFQRAKSLNQPLSVGQALLIIAKVCSGLDYAHRKKDLEGQDLNVVHRDISPQNILVSYEGEVKLVDFGIAKAASQSSETRTGFLKGKLSYMAPEQAWGKPVDRRTDIFAVGIVLYEMLTGHKLFKGDNDFNTLEKIREAKVEPPPTKLNAQIAPELEAIILKTLAREPEDRFQSAAELQIALEDHCLQKGYDVSSVRLSQNLQGLFSEDLKQDNRRFRQASGGATGISEQDQSTRIRREPREGRDTTPSRLARGQVEGRLAKTKKRSSPRRVAVLSLIFLFLSAVWMADSDHFILYSVKIRFPESERIIRHLDQMPERAAHYLVSLPVFHRNREPAPDSQDRLAVVAQNPQPEGKQVAEETSTMLSSPPASAMGPDEVKETEVGQRFLTKAERDEIQRLFKEAQEDYDQKRLEEVELKLRRIIELNPRIPRAYHLLGMVVLEQEDPAGALRVFEEASRTFPNSPLLHYDLGFLYFNQGIVSLARLELSKALKLSPEGPNAERARSVLEQIEQAPGIPSVPVKTQAEPLPPTEESRP
jgi:serine/threonine protein kinase